MSRPNTDVGSTEPFSPIEEEFFRAGDALSAEAAEEWSRLVPPPPPPRPVARQVARQVARPVSNEPVAEEDWDWQIAIARARHSTSS
jgi:hypothetical protein